MLAGGGGGATVRGSLEMGGPAGARRFSPVGGAPVASGERLTSSLTSCLDFCSMQCSGFRKHLSLHCSISYSSWVEPLQHLSHCSLVWAPNAADTKETLINADKHRKRIVLPVAGPEATLCLLHNLRFVLMDTILTS